MSILRVLSIILMAVVLMACGEKIKQAQQAMDVAKGLTKAAADLPAAMEAAEKRRQERIERGDTLALPYEELGKYLPESIAGYTAQGEMQGQSMKMQGMLGYSSANRRYTNDANGTINVNRPATAPAPRDVARETCPLTNAASAIAKQALTLAAASACPAATAGT